MLRAVEHVRPMRGGAQSHLIRADDGHCYVVKALNNPQHPLVLANEWIGCGIAHILGLSVPHVEVMELSGEFIKRSPNLNITYGCHARMPVAEGYAFASRVPVPPNHSCYDYLPEMGLERVRNLYEFAGILCLDKWLANADGRQAIFCRTQGQLHAFFIDFGFCMNGGDWTFPDHPLRGLYSRNQVYQHITGWDSFEPWLSRIEAFSYHKLHAIAMRMPLEWVPDLKARERLFDHILNRRKKVRDLIRTARYSTRAPFASWTAPETVYHPTQCQLAF